jgi:hypothetical protein
MKMTQTRIFVSLFTVTATLSGGISGCATGSAPHSYRHLAADESGLVRAFAASIAKESGLGSQTAVEEVLNQIVKDNSDSLSSELKNGTKLRSLGDVSALEESEQKKVLNQLARIPGFADRLATNADVVRAARLEALASLQEDKSVTTEAVSDIHAPSATSQADAPFAKILERDPELKSDVDQMISEDHFIAAKTGTPVLGKGCKDLQDPESARNVATMVEGVRRDVASGDAKDASGVSRSLHKNMSYTLGTEADETSRRVCVLAKPDGCAVFNEAMCR